MSCHPFVVNLFLLAYETNLHEANISSVINVKTFLLASVVVVLRDNKINET